MKLTITTPSPHVQFIVEMPPRLPDVEGLCRAQADTYRLLWGLCWACDRIDVTTIMDVLSLRRAQPLIKRLEHLQEKGRIGFTVEKQVIKTAV
jgi:hypothetical protein